MCDRAVDVRLRVLRPAPHVQHDDRGGGGGPGRGRRRSRVGKLASGRRPTPAGVPVAAPAGRSMPMRTSSRWASATCSGGLAEQGQRGAPRDQPAQVGGEAAVEPEVQRAGHVPGGERGAVPQVDHPLAGLDATPQLGRVRAAGCGQVRGAGAGGVGRAHVRVVGGVGVQPGQQLARRRPARPGSAPGWPASPADGRGRRPRTGWPSRSCRTRGSGSTRARRAAGRPAGAPRRTGRAPARRCGRGRAGPGGRSSRTAATRR